MSTLQFPKNPAINDEYDWEGFKYVYDGQKWKTIGVGYNPVNDLKDKLEPRIDELEDDVTHLQSGNSSLVQAVNSLNVRVTAEEEDTKDWEGFTAELLAQGGVPDNGLPDELGASQRVDAIKALSVRNNFEVYRRSYAGAGYNLVTGSFEQGGTITSATDALLHESTGKAYTGPVGPVAPNSSPSSDFIDRSKFYSGTRVFNLLAYVETYPTHTDAWLAMLADVNAAGHGSVFIPNTGSPYEIMIPEGTPTNVGVFYKCDGINIFSDGATIKIKDGARVGYSHAGLCSAGLFIFYMCKNVRMSNLSCDGNLAALDVAQPPLPRIDDWGFGVQLISCDNVIIENCIFKSFGTDGILVGRNYWGGEPIKPCTNISMRNVTSTGARRQALSITGCQGMTIDNSYFMDTGNVTNKNTPPRAGIDLEPDNALAPNSNIKISNSVIGGNAGSQVVLDSNANLNSNILFDHCTITQPDTSGANGVWAKNKTVTFRNCTINGTILNFYGKMVDCVQMVDRAISGSYCIDLNNTSGCLLLRHDLTCTTDKRLINFDGANAVDDKKILKDSTIKLVGDALASGTYHSLLRQNSAFENVDFIHTGAAPVSPYTLSQSGPSSRTCRMIGAGFRESDSGVKAGASISAGTGTITLGNYTNVIVTVPASSPNTQNMIGGLIGDIVTLRNTSSTPLVIEHGTGSTGTKFTLKGASNASIQNGGVIQLEKTSSSWLEISRSF